MSAASEAAAACLVCGKASTLRCSACAAKFNIDLYFCSTEHQKLIWPFHRVVCGERAHPFRLPPLSEEEVQVCVARLTCLPENEEDVRTQNVFRKLLHADRRNPEEIKGHFQNLVGEEIPLVDRRLLTTQPSSDEFGTLRMIRLLGAWWTSRVEPAISPGLEFLETFQTLYRSNIKSGFDVADDSQWYSEYCHRLAALVALMVLARRQHNAGTPIGNDLLTARRASVLAIGRFLERVTDPARANFAAYGIRNADNLLECIPRPVNELRST
ncbi:hypothetical protein JCM3774_001806 [Rhodotorula dairenensis]